MVKGLALEIRFFRELDSTQKRLVADLRAGCVAPPIVYVAEYQSAGIGSRGSAWIGRPGNLFFSFALAQEDLPPDLPLASASIYFSYLLKEELAGHGSRVWLKWPNDFYLEKKIGGCITQLVGQIVVCGIGLNVAEAPDGFGKLDVSVDPKAIVESYVSLLEQKRSWKQIFSKYRIEFYKSKSFSVHRGSRRIDLSRAELAEDGAIVINGERIYSLR